MTFTTNPIAMPALLVIWTLDAYLLAISTRVILGRLTATRGTRFVLALGELVDPLAHWTDRRLCGWRNRSNPTWLPWFVVFGCALAMRFLIVWFVFRVI